MPRNLDINQLAKRLVDQATGEAPKLDAKKQATGRKGGAIGGKKRMAALRETERLELSTTGVATRKPPAPSDAGGVKVTKIGL